QLSLPRRAYAFTMRKLVSWLGLQVVLIHRRPLVSSADIPATIRRNYEFVTLTAREALPFADDATLEMSRRFVLEASLRGDLCFAVLYRGNLVAYYWHATRGIAPFNRDFDIEFPADRQTYGY